MEWDMKKIKYFLLILLLPATFSGCRQNIRIPDGSLIAFSLREAQQNLKQNTSRPDSALITLGGITRLAGMVIDRENNDIILIGKKSRQLPEACFDDLVIALRARMVHDELPMVSIDPVKNTHITGKQEVRFGGRIENTSFGKDFLDSDILLKKYSLELEKQIQCVESYKKLILNDEINTLLRSGIRPLSIDWVDVNHLSNFYGESIESETANQARFWFNYKDPYRVRIREDVFCIMSLDIVVEREVQSSSLNERNSMVDLASLSPDLTFAEGFSNNFYSLSEIYPVLKKMKLLFDMTAIAEGLNHTANIPDLHFLLYEYNVPEVPTQKDFDLIEKCAVIERSDGKTSLIHISGGIASSVEVEWLNAGDVSYLKQFALDSRPDKNSLFWKIPLDEWEMPNSTGIVVRTPEKQKDLGVGCNFVFNSVELNSSKTNHNQFSGFKPIRYTEPVNTKGVQMRMEIDSLHFNRVDSLRILKDRILNKQQRNQ
jgi:hypothetical protein